jgi:hypothetical protein
MLRRSWTCPTLAKVLLALPDVTRTLRGVSVAALEELSGAVAVLEPMTNLSMLRSRFLQDWHS